MRAELSGYRAIIIEDTGAHPVGRRARALARLMAAIAVTLVGCALVLCASAVSYAEDGSKGTVGITASPSATGAVPKGATPGWHGPEAVTPTPTYTVTARPTGESGGWEEQALRALAESLGWPTAVSRDSAGRLSVSSVVSGVDWSSVSIRPFEFPAGAIAAFDAEQEDARLAGYEVVQETFYSYPAYMAVLYDSNGREAERRLHWLADSRVMGVDSHGTPARSLDQSAVGQQLIALAVRYGMTPPLGWPRPTATTMPGGTPSATPPAACNAGFDDVPEGYWASGYIEQLACRGIVTGYADGTFRPDNRTTRAQLAKMIVLAEGWPLVSPAQPSFSDVGPDNVFYAYVETARARGVVSGYANYTFRPYGAVTRAQVAKMLVRARGWALQVDAPVRLCDVPAGHWAWAYIQVAIDHGIFTGYADGCFYPEAPATRAQLAKLLVLSYEW